MCSGQKRNIRQRVPRAVFVILYDCVQCNDHLLVDLSAPSAKRLTLIHCNYILKTIDAPDIDFPTLKKGLKINTKVDLPEPLTVTGSVLVTCKKPLASVNKAIRQVFLDTLPKTSLRPNSDRMSLVRSENLKSSALKKERTESPSAANSSSVENKHEESNGPADELDETGPTGMDQTSDTEVEILEQSVLSSSMRTEDSTSFSMPSMRKSLSMSSSVPRSSSKASLTAMHDVDAFVEPEPMPLALRVRRRQDELVKQEWKSEEFFAPPSLTSHPPRKAPACGNISRSTEPGLHLSNYLPLDDVVGSLEGIDHKKFASLVYFPIVAGKWSQRDQPIELNKKELEYALNRVRSFYRKAEKFSDAVRSETKSLTPHGTGFNINHPHQWKHAFDGNCANILCIMRLLYGRPGRDDCNKANHRATPAKRKGHLKHNIKENGNYLESSDQSKRNQVNGIVGIIKNDAEYQLAEFIGGKTSNTVFVENLQIPEGKDKVEAIAEYFTKFKYNITFYEFPNQISMVLCSHAASSASRNLSADSSEYTLTDESYSITSGGLSLLLHAALTGAIRSLGSVSYEEHDKKRMSDSEYLSRTQSAQWEDDTISILAALCILDAQSILALSQNCSRVSSWTTFHDLWRDVVVVLIQFCPASFVLQLTRCLSPSINSRREVMTVASVTTFARRLKEFVADAEDEHTRTELLDSKFLPTLERLLCSPDFHVEQSHTSWQQPFDCLSATFYMVTTWADQCFSDRVRACVAKIAAEECIPKDHITISTLTSLDGGMRKEIIDEVAGVLFKDDQIGATDDDDIPNISHAIRRYQNTGSSGLSKNDIEKVVRPAMLLIHGFAVRESEHTLHFHLSRAISMRRRREAQTFVNSVLGYDVPVEVKIVENIVEQSANSLCLNGILMLKKMTEDKGISLNFRLKREGQPLVSRDGIHSEFGADTQVTLFVDTGDGGKRTNDEVSRGIDTLETASLGVMGVYPIPDREEYYKIPVPELRQHIWANKCTHFLFLGSEMYLGAAGGFSTAIRHVPPLKFLYAAPMRFLLDQSSEGDTENFDVHGVQVACESDASFQRMHITLHDAFIENHGGVSREGRCERAECSFNSRVVRSSVNKWCTKRNGLSSEAVVDLISRAYLVARHACDGIIILIDSFELATLHQLVTKDMGSLGSSNVQTLVRVKFTDKLLLSLSTLCDELGSDEELRKLLLSDSGRSRSIDFDEFELSF